MSLYNVAFRLYLAILSKIQSCFKRTNNERDAINKSSYNMSCMFRPKQTDWYLHNIVPRQISDFSKCQSSIEVHFRCDYYYYFINCPQYLIRFKHTLNQSIAYIVLARRSSRHRTYLRLPKLVCLCTGTKNARNPWPNLAPSPSRPRTIQPDDGRPALTIRCCPSPRPPVTRHRRWPTCRGHRILRAPGPPPRAGTQRRHRHTAGLCLTRPLTRYLRPPSESNAF